MINELQSIMSDIAAEIEAKKHIVGRLSRCEPCARRERICYLIVNSEIPSDRGARGRAVRAKIVRPFLYFVGINFASLVDI
jgi:hypothetical protein